MKYIKSGTAHSCCSHPALSPDCSGADQAGPLNATNQFLVIPRHFPDAQTVKSAHNAGGLSSIPGSRRSSGEGTGNPLQYSCWKIQRMEEPGVLQSIGSQADWVTTLSLSRYFFFFFSWKNWELSTTESVLKSFGIQLFFLPLQDHLSGEIAYWAPVVLSWPTGSSELILWENPNESFGQVNI